MGVDCLKVLVKALPLRTVMVQQILRLDKFS